MKDSPAAIVIAAIALMLGIMLSLQFQANKHSPQYVAPYRWASLTRQVDELHKQNDVLANEVITLRSKLSQPGFDSKTKKLEKSLMQYSTAAGLTSVKGAGIILVLDDANDPLLEPDQALVHYSYLLRIINELNSAGAKAISINGERVVSTTEVRCAGPTILMNMRRVAAPFEIRAIGDPEKMEKQLNRSAIWAELLRIRIPARLKQQKEMIVPAFKGIIPAEYAQPVGL